VPDHKHHLRRSIYRWNLTHGPLLNAPTEPVLSANID
jgi:hypothetical protein